MLSSRFLCSEILMLLKHISHETMKHGKGGILGGKYNLWNNFLFTFHHLLSFTENRIINIVCAKSNIQAAKQTTVFRTEVELVPALNSIYGFIFLVSLHHLLFHPLIITVQVQPVE